MRHVVTQRGEVCYRWPPIAGQKRFDLDKNVASTSLVRSSYSGKRVFAHLNNRTSEEIEGASPRAHRALLKDMLAATFKADPPLGADGVPQFAFVSAAQSWKPTFKAGSIPPPPPIKKNEEEDATPKKVTQASPRLLAPRKEHLPKPSPKPASPPPKVNVGKLVSRLAVDDTAHRQRKHEEAIRKATSRPATAKEPQIVENIDQLTARLFTEQVATRQRNHEALIRKLTTPKKPPSRPFDAASQKAFTERMYNKGIERERNAIAKAANKYIDQRTPKSARRTDEQWQQTVERISKPRSRSEN